MSHATVFMHRDFAPACAFLPQAIDRLAAFCVKYDTETKPDEIREQVWRMFGCGDYRLGLWVIVKDSKTVIGHLLAQPEPVSLERGPWQYVLIRQAESDKHENTLAATQAAMASVEEWTRRLGLSRLMLLTHRRDDVMSRKWGFKYYKALMDKVI